MTKKILSAILISFCFVLQAQQPAKKEHYHLINDNFEFTLAYEKAMTHTDLDSLRFLNERRLVPVNGTTIFIELYSAQELYDWYRKPISPLNIKDPLTARKVKLKLADNNYSLIVVPITDK